MAEARSWLDRLRRGAADRCSAPFALPAWAGQLALKLAMTSTALDAHLTQVVVPLRRVMAHREPPGRRCSRL